MDNKKVIEKNKKIMESNPDDLKKLSDGSHTFNELYDHRSIIFAALINCNKDDSWKSKKYDDGKDIEDDYFLAGIKRKGAIRYHIKLKYWDLFECAELDKCPKWDGSTPDDCLKALKKDFCSGDKISLEELFYWL